jgi:hypothetical protein
VIDTHFGVFGGGQYLGFPAQPGARAVGIAVHQQLHHLHEVVLGAGQPVLQGEEVGPHVLCGARDEAQDLGQSAQHLHLLRAGGGLAFGAAVAVDVVAFALAPHALEHRHEAAGGRAHVEFAHARELHHLGGGHGADHGVARVTPRFQRRQDRQEVVLHEQHGGDYDVAARDVVQRALQGGGVVGPFRRGVRAQGHAGQGLGQTACSALRGAGQMAVHGDQNDPHRRSAGPGFSG